MRWIAPAVALAVGVVVGVGAMLAARTVEAQQFGTMQEENFRLLTIPAPRAVSRPDARFVGTSARTLVQSGPSPVFLKDRKTEGCWLAGLGERNEVVALAVAPAAACQ
jgi:hypothetical protein